jgi:hypothetical protein
MFHNRFAVGLTVCTLALVLASSQAQAQTKPFKITGGGAGPDGIPLPGDDPRPHWAIGNATQLGKYYGQGEVQTLTANFNPDGTITGTFQSPVAFVFTAANGDNLACYYGNPDHGATTVGTFTLVPVPGFSGWYVAYWIAEFVPYDPLCTGRFQGVTGGWIMYAQSEPFQPFAPPTSVGYTWYGEGTLTFSKGN